ncbi:2-amino-4-hydroxy-6-hydroxymethyldihydropteridine diphosphokinase [uncultured Nevskia sp.]|uniref:2-amino-4-hydroxy-6- hydroxymethyldihydropteridine diphosphokinase n=1 Tax=uncultured Nevskia sp. TaxID=228950 RepID=UPI00260068D2|nr:2-amino-4-hydroxy-6-hydroxymethyldihydropteridine diphosphokinase [uncultured Nevskia sp.]
MRVYLGLGANLGMPAAQVERALALIAVLPDTTLVARSPLYRSDPVGPAGQPDYCNAACLIDTTLEPLALLDAVQAIEVDAGRIRDGIRWAARLLDIDLLHIEGLSLSTPRLRLPHPHLQERNWVLVPLADFAPTLDIPGLGIVSELATEIGRAGLRPWS